MHEQRIIHGDLRGVRFRLYDRCLATALIHPQANVLINEEGNACLTGFNLVTIASDQSTITSPPRAEGTIPWMSPELLYPERFGLENTHPTMASDCYALGMVIYEVLSGRPPFYPYRDPEVVYLVSEGEHPKRPRGEEGGAFTDAIWGVLELCWKQRPCDRLNSEGVLVGLEGNVSTWWQPFGVDSNVEPDIDDQPVATESPSSMFFSISLRAYL